MYVNNPAPLRDTIMSPFYGLFSINGSHCITSLGILQGKLSGRDKPAVDIKTKVHGPHTKRNFCFDVNGTFVTT